MQSPWSRYARRLPAAMAAIAAAAVIVSCAGATTGTVHPPAAQRAMTASPRYLYRVTSPTRHGDPLILGTNRPLSSADEARLLRHYPHGRIAPVTVRPLVRGKAHEH